MTTVVVADGEAQQSEPGAPVVWHPLTRVLFRFVTVYCTTLCLVYPVFVGTLAGWFRHSIPWIGRWQWEVFGPLYRWVGRHFFDVDAQIRHPLNGPDGPVYWVMVFCTLVTALVGTVVWSILDRHRLEYRAAAGWFLLFLRLCTAGVLAIYGMTKLIPVQMPGPSLTTLVTPVGQLKPSGLLWVEMGVSHPYEMLLGSAEFLAAMLLFVPRTALVGSMLGIVCTAQVFVTNMSFDVGVKLLAGHLLLFCLILFAPQARRVLTVLLSERSPGPVTAPYPFRTRRSRRVAALAQAALGLWVVASWQGMYREMWHQQHTHPPLYGIWSVQDYQRDGQTVPLVATDRDRWQQVIFDQPGVLTFQRADGSWATARVTVDTTADRITLTGPAPAGVLAFQQPGPGRLELDGQLDTRAVHLSLARVDPDGFPLRSVGLHWVQ